MKALTLNLVIAVVGGAGIWLAYRSWTAGHRVRLSRTLEEVEEGPATLAGHLQARLDQAGLEVSAREFATVAGSLGAVAAAGTFLVTGTLALIPVSLVLAPVLYWSQLEGRRERRVRAYRDALADGVDIIKEAFRVTPTVQFGIQAVAEDGPPALQADFGQILGHLHQGASLEEATEAVAQRRRDPFFDMVREALVLRETEGGSIGQVLASISSLVREQGRIYRKMVAQQTQARLEAAVVCVAPLALFTLVKVTMPEYAGPFYGTPAGQLVLVVVALLDLLAYFCSKRIAASGMELARGEQN